MAVIPQLQPRQTEDDSIPPPTEALAVPPAAPPRRRPGSADCAQLLTENLGLLDRIVHAVARRHRLSAEEAADLSGAIRLKLVENDYDVLRRFEGRSSLRTYLVVVVQRHFLDLRVAEWGRWRPCREARRAGPAGVLLDRLLTRDGLSFDEAFEIMRTNHGVTESREWLSRLSLVLPSRRGRQFVGPEPLAALAAPDRNPEQLFEARLAADVSARLEAALASALALLTARDRLLLKLRFRDGFTVAEIARLLSVEQKPLYRRLERLAASMRREIERQGLDRDQVRELIGHPALAFSQTLFEAPA
jgi:RNA polymerase sigma factor for flagellar operon FliA